MKEGPASDRFMRSNNAPVQWRFHGLIIKQVNRGPASTAALISLNMHRLSRHSGHQAFIPGNLLSQGAFYSASSIYSVMIYNIIVFP